MMLFILPDWLTGFNFLLALFGFATLVAGAFVVLSLRKQEGSSLLQVERATAAEGLAKTREIEILTINAKKALLEEELEGVTAEHRALAGIKIGELMEFWVQKEDMEAKIKDQAREIRVLTKRKDGDI